ncbi:sigma-70 domain-containing protein, partial [Bacillus thuringiensis]
VPMIIGEIRRYLRDNNQIRVSRSLRDIAYKALQVRERLISETSKEPTAEDIAKVLEVPHEEIVFALDAIQDPVSLFEPIYNDGGDPIYVMDQISDERNKDSQWI